MWGQGGNLEGGAEEGRREGRKGRGKVKIVLREIEYCVKGNVKVSVKYRILERKFMIWVSVS